MTASARRGQRHAGKAASHVPGDGPRSRDDLAHQVLASPGIQQPVGGADPAGHHAVPGQDRGRDPRVAHGRLPVLHRVPALAHLRQDPVQRRPGGLRPPGQRRQVGNDRVAECAGAPRDRLADLEDLRHVIRPEHMAQHDDPRPGQGSDPYRLGRALGQRPRPPQRRGPQPRAVQVGVTELQRARPQAVLAGARAGRHQAVRLQGAQQPVHRRLGQAGPLCYLGHAKTRPAGPEDGTDLGRALYRLDHPALSAMPNNIQEMP
jgi:hypothetical protein